MNATFGEVLREVLIGLLITEPDRKKSRIRRRYPRMKRVSKWIPVPYTNLQLNPYPNTQLDLFCSDNLSFQCTAPRTWLTNCADPSMRLQSPTTEGCWLQSSSVHHSMKIMKLLGYKTLWCKNTAASSRTRAKLGFRSHFLHTCGIVLLCNLCHFLRPLK